MPNSGPKVVKSTGELKPKRIISSFWHTILIDKDGYLYKTGYVKCIGSEHGEYTKMALTGKVKLIALAKKSIVVVTEDNKI